ncbi:N(2)-fixation sustaining protein CowN [Aquabacterium sp.]|jgi:hypothetical protein|uniref:N(2)-fixation sustaining protein CowN n=1 Tax=Aquabacterium sp. TaxID=1872578 RepID=UPI0025C3FFE7|nr:N(2)-fixation sustaining protein CowN [Aquabacterium sp.]
MPQTHRPSAPSQTDRYVTFLGIDFDGQTRRVMQRIEQHTLGGGGQDNAFWQYFRQRRQARNGVQCDDLLLLASFVNQVRELFEAMADEEGLAMLDQLEDECF